MSAASQISFGTFSSIYAKSETVLKWLREPGADAFRTALQEWKLQTERVLMNEKDPPVLYRAQGKLEVIIRILEMREELQKRGILEP